MSRIEKLKGLLARVEQRRAEPRLVAVAGGHAVSSANTNLASPVSAPVARAARETPLELAAKPATLAPIEDALSAPPPSSIPPPSLASTEAVQLGTSLPPVARVPSAPVGPSSTVPPAAEPVEAPGRSSTELAAPTRIAPSPALPFDAAVRVVSSPRLDTPKTFGELLDQSLALRPKTG